jgi:uncharacterized cupin superfamily protein
MMGLSIWEVVGMSQVETSISIVSARQAPFVPWPQEVDELYEGDPSMNIAVLWVAPDRTSANGVWQGFPSRIRLTHPFDETFVVLEGRMTWTPVGAQSQALGPGDVITIPRGAVNEIEIHEPVTKVWTVYAAEGLALYIV